jgi:hypothetical protein
MYDPRLRLRPPDSLRLLRLDFDFTDALESERAGRRPQPRDTLVAVARSRYRVRVHSLDPLLFAWLEALREWDGAVLEAPRRAGEAAGRQAEAAITSILASTVRAIDSGLVVVS